MRAAGLRVVQPGPVARWLAAWVAPGVCVPAGGARVAQRVMVGEPLLGVVGGPNAWRRTCRPDTAPPASLPPGTVQIYIGRVTQGAHAAWGCVMIRGDSMNVRDDCSATLEFDIGGASLSGSAAEAAIDDAMSAALRILQQGQWAAVPAVLRAPTSDMARLAGLLGVRSAVPRKLWAAAVQHRTAPLWLASCDTSSIFPWAYRAAAIAAHCLPGYRLGAVPPTWAHLPHAPALSAPDDCCVCLQAMVDSLPGPSGRHPAAAGLYACSHAAVCRGCDSVWMRRPNVTCPMCRAPRARWLQAGP